MGAHSTLNLTLFHLINGASGHHFWDVILSSVSDNGFSRELILACPYVYFWFQRPKPDNRATVIAGLVGGLVAVLVARALAHVLPFEERPLYDVASGFRALSVPAAPDMERWSAFPSDHAALCIGLALGLYRSNKLFSVAMAVVALLVFGLPRIYMGVHYPSDIAAGAVVGLACAIVVGLPAAMPVWSGIGRLEISCGPLFYTASFLLLAEVSQMFDGLRNVLRALRAAL